MATVKQPPPYDGLERIFHEPSRLAIMCALCAADGGLTFSQLRDQCDLTDGNLSRHLKALQERGAIEIRKAFVGVKPQTTVFLSEQGLKRFDEYLQALGAVLDQARNVIAGEAGTAPTPTGIDPRAVKAG